LPVVSGTVVAEVPPDSFDYAVSCVPPDAAEEVAPIAATALTGDGLLFDWNSVAPTVKRRMAAAALASTVDVALLDSLDAAPDRPTLAVSGAQALRGAAVLESLRFRVSVAGDEVGDAAALKYLRSIFMKTLEALTLEFASLASDLDRGGIVRDSIERNLGSQFVRFMDMLVATNRVHAERRSSELTDAVATFVAEGVRPELAQAAAGVLRQVTGIWNDSAAPPTGADLEDLTVYLRNALWAAPAST
jgi:hypothetical protein